ncbi:MAG: lysine decarboxylase [Acidobacteria bacterium]|nr:MAG: lysine decarboxylase [Acidobacteriota bacterium]
MRDRSVAVFGSSEPREGEALYEEAREVGRLLAREGYGVVNGGYGGVMEGASRGAREGGGRSIGVTTSAFSRGASNRFLTEEFQEHDLFLRTRRLIELSDAYIILRGKSGTLAELTFLWALSRGGLLRSTRIVLLGEFWEEVLSPLKNLQMVETEQLEITRLARTPEQAVNQIASFFR